ELPVTPNGKVDRRALPAPDYGDRPGGRAPRGPLEELFCTLVAEVLGLERVGADESFFALGGDSIMSLQLVARARRMGVALTPRQVFDEKTPAGMAAAAEVLDPRASEEPLSDGSLVDLDEGELAGLRARVPGLTEVWPLSPLQEGLLFHAAFGDEGPDVYVGQRMLELTGPVDPARVRRAWETLLA